MTVSCRGGEAVREVRLSASALFTQERSEFIHSISSKPLINLMPLDGAVVIYGATKEPRDIFHSQQVIAFHCGLEGFGIISPRSLKYKVPEFIPIVH
jgi:hypothetical protein